MPGDQVRVANRSSVLLVFLILFLASVVPIRSYDYFWHLATGRWIVEHRACPATDPFGVASDQVPWINGEWLSQIILYAGQASFGHRGWSIARGLFVALLFTALFLRLRKEVAEPLAVAIIALCWYGASHRFGVRPELMATLIAVPATLLLVEPRTAARRGLYLLLTAIWMNLHPSALLAPLAAAIAVAAFWMSGAPSSRRERIADILFVGASALMLTLNPHGIEGVLAPFHLMSLVGSGSFVNLEWLPTSPRQFPLVYIAIAVSAVIFLRDPRRRANLPRIALFALFSILAIRYVRNHGFFFATLPLFLGSSVPAVSGSTIIGGMLRAASFLFIALIALRGAGQTGPDETVFPIRAVEQLAASALSGNIYNPDQFGGLVIWTFYPERRALTDGRNELYRTFLAEYDLARRDSRHWSALLAKYRIRLAVDEYRPPLEVIDPVRKTRRWLPASLAYFPRERWALIGFDDRAMVFAKRDSIPPGSRIEEFRLLVPDASQLPPLDPSQRRLAEEEIRRAESRLGRAEIVKKLRRLYLTSNAPGNQRR